MKLPWAVVLAAASAIFAAGGVFTLQKVFGEDVATLKSDIASVKSDLGNVKIEMAAMKEGRVSDAKRWDRFESSMDRLNDKVDRLLVKLGDRLQP